MSRNPAGVICRLVTLYPSPAIQPSPLMARVWCSSQTGSFRPGGGIRVSRAAPSHDSPLFLASLRKRFNYGPATTCGRASEIDSAFEHNLDCSRAAAIRRSSDH